MAADLPDPFDDDPVDPTEAFADEAPSEPLAPDEREDVLADLADLEVFEALLSIKGIRGLVVDCEDCEIPHFFDWDLLRGNLRQLLDVGQTRVHEPAYNPDPTHYVAWEYARGYTDGVTDASETAEDG